MTRVLVLLLVILGALGGAGGFGWYAGRASLRARLDAATVAAQRAAADTAAKLADAEQKRRLLATQLEAKAYAQPVVNPGCLPVERVRRLNLR